MKTILVTPKNEKDFEFLTTLLNKLKYEPKILYDEEKEDMGLLKAMLEEKKGEYVSEEKIMKHVKTNLK